MFVALIALCSDRSSTMALRHGRRSPRRSLVIARSTASSRSTGTMTRASSSPRSAGSTRKSCIRCRSPLASARTRSAWTADSSASRGSSTFRRIGPKVLMIERNTRYRAVSGSRARAAGRRGFIRHVGPLGFHRRGGRGGSRPRRRDAVRPPRRSRHRLQPEKGGPGKFTLDKDRSALDLPAHEGISEEHRDRVDTHLRHFRGPWPLGPRDDADPRGHHRPPADLLHRVAPAGGGRRLPAPAARPPGRRLRHRIL